MPWMFHLDCPLGYFTAHLTIRKCQNWAQFCKKLKVHIDHYIDNSFKCLTALYSSVPKLKNDFNYLGNEVLSRSRYSPSAFWIFPNKSASLSSERWTPGMFSTSITIGDFVTFFISPKNSELKRKIPTIITKNYWQTFCLKRNSYTVLVGEAEGKKPPVRPRHRWEDVQCILTTNRMGQHELGALTCYWSLSLFVLKSYTLA